MSSTCSAASAVLESVSNELECEQPRSVRQILSAGASSIITGLPSASTTMPNLRLVPATNPSVLLASMPSCLSAVDVQGLACDECGAFEIEHRVDDIADLS